MMVIVVKTWDFYYSNKGKLQGIRPCREVWLFRDGGCPDLLYRRKEGWKDVG